MSELNIRVRAQLDIDRQQSQQNVANAVRDLNNVRQKINLPVDLDTGEILNRLQRITTGAEIRIPATIDTSGMKNSIDSVKKKVDEFVHATGGKIKNMRITDLWANMNSDAMDKALADNANRYQAVVQYETAIGDVITKVVTLKDDLSGVSDVMTNMNVNFQQQINTNNALAKSIALNNTNLRNFVDEITRFSAAGNAIPEAFMTSLSNINFEGAQTPEQLAQQINQLKTLKAEFAGMKAEAKQGTEVDNIINKARVYAQELATLRTQASQFMNDTRMSGSLNGIDFNNIFTENTLNNMKSRLDEAKNVLKQLQTEANNIQIGQKLANDINLWSSKLETFKAKAASIMNVDETFRNMVNGISFTQGMDQGQLDAMISRLKVAGQELSRLNAMYTGKDLASNGIDNMAKKANAMETAFKRVSESLKTMTIPADLKQKLDAVTEALEKYKNATTGTDKVTAYNALQTAFTSAKTAVDDFIRAEKAANNYEKALQRLNSIQARYQAVATRYSAFKSDPQLSAEYQQLGTIIDGIRNKIEQFKATGVWDPSVNTMISDASSRLGQFNNHVVIAGKNTKSLGMQLKEAFSKFSYWISITSIVMRGINTIKKAVSNVKELDEAMTSLKKITDLSADSYEKFLKNAESASKRIGSNVSDLVAQTAAFVKLGYSFKDAQGLAETATIFSNIADFDSIDTATEGLVSTMKAFNMSADDAMNISDKLNEVANNYAVNANDLTSAIQSAASALSMAGNSLDESIAMTTAVAEITQNADGAANALRTLSMRLRGASTELSNAGEDTDGMCESTSKLREKVMALTGGIDIMANSAGTQFKSTYQIMKEISAVWDGMSDINQAALLETIAGKNRANAVSALISNWSQAEKALDNSMKSSGSTMKGQEKWLDSIEAKTQQLQATWQGLSNSMFDTGVIGGYYDALTGVLEVIKSIVDNVGALPALLGAVTGVMSIRGNWFGTTTNSAGKTVGTIGQTTWGNLWNNVMSGGGIGSIFNGDVNTAQIDAIKGAMGDTALTADTLKTALTGANGEIANMNRATINDVAGLQGGTEALKAMGIQTGVLTGKMALATIGAKALNMALSMGISVAISLLFKGISKLAQAIGDLAPEKQIQKLKDSISSLQDDYAENQSEIEDINDELQTTVDRMNELKSKGNLTFVEKEELSDLHQSNQELERRRDNLEAIQNLKMEEARNNLRSLYAKEYADLKFAGIDITADPIEVLIDSYSSLLNMKLSGKQLTEGQKENLKLWEEKLRTEYENLQSTYLDAYGDIDDEFTRKVKQDAEDIYKALNPGEFITENFNKVIDSPAFKTAKENLIQLAEEETLTAADITAYPELAQALAEVGINAEQAVEQLLALYQAVVQAQETGYSLPNLRSNYTATGKAASTISEVMGDQGTGSSITEEQYESLVEAGDKYADCVENINGYLQLNAEKANEVVQAEYEEQKVTVSLANKQAKLKYKENAKEIANLEKQLKGYGDTEEEQRKQIEEQIKSLKRENNNLVDTIEGYSLLASELDYATSAYKRWLDAQDSPEAGDGYEGLRKALEQLQDGLESGKVGTVKFKAAAELLVPEGKDVDSYMKTLERYLTEDSTGLQNYINDMFKGGFLDKGENGYFFKDGITVEDIAKGLGLTEEAVQYMTTALKDYGWDVSLFDNLLGDGVNYKAYEDALAQVEAAQEKYDAVMADSTATVEEQTAAYNELQDAKEAAADAGEKSGATSEAEELIKQYEEMKKKLQEALEGIIVPVTAEIREYNNAEGVDPNTKVSGLVATISRFIGKAKEVLRGELKLTDLPANVTSFITGTAEWVKEQLHLNNQSADVKVKGEPIDALTAQLLAASGAKVVKVTGEPDGKTTYSLLVDENGEKTVIVHASPYDSETTDLLNQPTEKEIHYTIYTSYGDTTNKQNTTATPTPSPTPTPTPNSNSAESLEKTAEKIESTSKKVDVTWGQIVQAVKDSNGELDAAAESLGITIDRIIEEFGKFNVTNPNNQLDSVSDWFKTHENITLIVGANTNPAIDAANTAVKLIGEKKATITVNAEYDNISGVTQLAKGTKYAKDEDAIVGEAGVETWIHDGKFKTVGENGAELVHLSRGDQILTASETKKLFGSNGKRRGNAFEGGTNVLDKLKSALSGIKTFFTSSGQTSSQTTSNASNTSTQNNTTSVSGGGTTALSKQTTKKTKNTSSAKSIDDILEELEKLVDWIPAAVENAKKKTDDYIKAAENAIGYINKNRNLDNALESINAEIQLNNQAYNRYITQADAVAQQLGLSGDIIDKIKNGTIDIESYDEDMRNSIKEYEKWWDNAVGVRDTLEDLNDQIKEITSQRLENITKHFENINGLIESNVGLYQQLIEENKQYGRVINAEDYSKIIDQTEETVRVLTEERDVLKEEMKNVEVGSELWYEYSKVLVDLDKSISEATVSIGEMNDEIADIPVNNLEIAANAINHLKDTMNALMKLQEAQSIEVGEAMYQGLISTTQEEINNLETANKVLTEQLNGLDPLSEKYQEVQESIRQNEIAILNAKASQEEWNDSIVDTQIDALEKQNDEYKKQVEMMDAIENLEKAKQKRALVYREGTGFDYEAIASDVKAATDTLQDLVYERQIDALENSKETNNLYDRYGNELVKISSVNGVDLSAFNSAVASGDSGTDILRSSLSGMNISEIAKSYAGQNNTITIESGAIVMNGVNDVEEMANAIVNQLPGYIAQELYK